MGKGRKPVPSHLKMVRGTDRPDRGAKNEPKPQRARPSAPDHMSDLGCEAWEYIVGLADRMGVLTEADAVALELLCEARADWISARNAIRDYGGETYTTEAGLIKAHPAVAMRNDAARRLQSMLSEFGMSPSSRSKVNARGDDDQEDPASKFFG